MSNFYQYWAREQYDHAEHCERLTNLPFRNAIMAGIRTMPYSVGACITSIFAGFAVSKFKSYKEVIIGGWAFFTLGVGLMIMLDSRSSIAEQVFVTLIPAAGLGCLFQPPLIAIQASMPVKVCLCSSLKSSLFFLMNPG